MCDNSTRHASPNVPDQQFDAAGRALAGMMRLGPVRVQITGQDRYRRHLGIVWAGGANLNCAMILHHNAVRRYRAIRC